MAYHPQLVTHPDDPACPGHDINKILAEKSRDVGYCLCVHPMMQLVDFSGMGCEWCGQPVTKDAVTPEAKDIRTQAVRDVLGDGTGKCARP